MASVERILQDRAMIVQPVWLDKFTAISPKLHGYQQHPSDYFNLYKAWLSA